MFTTMKENGNDTCAELDLEALEKVAGGFSWQDILDIFLTGAAGVPD